MMIDFKKVRRKIEYDPRRYTSKTVLWFTREEIKTLKSCSGCNVIMFSLIIIILLICLILFLTRSYPFTVVEARIVHTSFGSILLLQAAISILGYYAVRAENPCIIDVYCVMNSILIASQIGLLVIFSNFGLLIIVLLFFLLHSFYSLFIYHSVSCIILVITTDWPLFLSLETFPILLFPLSHVQPKTGSSNISSITYCFKSSS